MSWTEWYVALALFPSAILFLLVKDQVRVANTSLRLTRRRVRTRRRP